MTVAYLQIRSGSKGIPHKNIKPLCGKPLFYWAMKAAEACPDIGHVFVTTDSKDYKAMVERHAGEGVTVSIVPEIADTDLQDTELAKFARKWLFDAVVLLQATSPLTTSGDLTRAIRQFDMEACDSMVTVCRQHRFVWQSYWGCNYSPNYEPAARPRRQDWDGILIETGCFWITRRDALLKYRNRLGGKIGMFEMPPQTYFEIDDPADWVIMEQLLERQMRGQDG